MDQKNIINPTGAHWKHKLLKSLATSKEFPTRIRIINMIRKFWGLYVLQYTTPSGLNLLLDTSDWVQSQIYYHGNYEQKSIALFKQLAADATVILDVGAHIGQFGLECAFDDKAQAKKIFAFEVNPKTFAYLFNNIQINNFKNITAVLGAVSNSADILNINIPGYWNMGNTMISTETDYHASSYMAASFSLSAFLKKQGLNHVDVIKIDLEGHELPVFIDLFAQGIYPQHIVFEYIPQVFKNAAVLMQLLIDNNYIVKDIYGTTYNGESTIAEQNLWATRK